MGWITFPIAMRHIGIDYSDKNRTADCSYLL